MSSTGYERRDDAAATASNDSGVNEANSSSVAQQSIATSTPKASSNTGGRNIDEENDNVTAEVRWDEAIAKHRMNTAVDKSISEQSTHPRARWQRAILYAQQISGPADKNSSTDGDEGEGKSLKRSYTATFKHKLEEAKARAYHNDPRTGKRKPFDGKEGGQKAIKIKKELEEQHWLEMIDRKHRYGSNLKYYFDEWSLSDEATGNFFRWLDYDGGAKLSLPKCPRDKLEAEQILYMSSDQRKHYLVIVDRESGKFCWKHPNEIAVKATGSHRPGVETTGRSWTDLGEGRGVAPAAAVPAAPRPDQYDYDSDTSESISSLGSDSVSSSSSGSVSMPRPGNLRRTSSTSLKAKDAAKASPDGSKPEKEEKGDTWIYVSDANYNLYCGIKQKGRFQHSSFLAGGPITSAGTMVIKDGILMKCNPMSGHYRTKAEYFKRFVAELEREGADLSNVKIGQTELKLWFIERANALHSLKGKTRRLEKRMEKRLNIHA